jgi:hypothetical protein
MVDNKEAESTLYKVMRDLDVLMPSRSTSNSTLTVNAGGIGLGIALVLFAFMAGLNWSLNTQLSDQNRKIERLEDYVAAIYAAAPHLKPKKEVKP